VASAWGISGKPVGQPGEVTLWSELVARDPKVAEALYYSGESQDWGSLYKVYEIIQTDLGKKIFKLSEQGKSKHELFTKTAQWEMRHSHAWLLQQKLVPPEEPMTLAAATRLVQTTLVNWLRWKIAKVPAS